MRRINVGDRIGIGIAVSYCMPFISKLFYSRFHIPYIFYSIWWLKLSIVITMAIWLYCYSSCTLHTRYCRHPLLHHLSSSPPFFFSRFFVPHALHYCATRSYAHPYIQYINPSSGPNLTLTPTPTFPAGGEAQSVDGTGGHTAERAKHGQAEPDPARRPIGARGETRTEIAVLGGFVEAGETGRTLVVVAVKRVSVDDEFL